MSRYWTRIALGALLVFGLGIAGLAAVRKGSAEFRNFLTAAAARLPLRLAHLGFRLDGRRVGEITALQVLRSGPDDPGRVTGEVRLTETSAAESLRACALTLAEERHLSRRSSFSCASQADLASGRLVEVGELRFQPAGFSRPLYLSEQIVSDWRHSGVNAVDASLRQDGSGGVHASGRFDLRDEAHGQRRGSFDLRADSQGAMLSVRDDQNRPLLELSADGRGLSLDVRDRRGRNLVRLLADSLGAALKVHK